MFGWTSLVDVESLGLMSVDWVTGLTTNDLQIFFPGTIPWGEGVDGRGNISRAIDTSFPFTGVKRTFWGTISFPLLDCLNNVPT